MRKAIEQYVTIKSWPHYGEKAVLTRQKRLENNEIQIKTYLMDCKHGQHELWIARDDI